MKRILAGKKKNKHASKRLKSGRGTAGKPPIIGACKRSGRVIASPISNTSREDLHGFIKKNVVPGSIIYTDDHPGYDELDEYGHNSVNHSGGEYVRGDVHTNAIESFWALFKRGYHGVFNHFTNKHVHRYISKFEMRWNMSTLNILNRFDSMLESVSVFRLTYLELNS